MAYTKTTFVNGQAPALSAEELNKMGQGIEDAITLIENSKAVAGTYTGDGTTNRTVNVGFRPKAVMVTNGSDGGFTSGTYRSGGFVVDGNPAIDKAVAIVEIVSSGFRVSYNNTEYVRTNTSGAVFNYLAWK